MYVVTTVTLTNLQGNEDTYEVGADVECEPGVNGWMSGYTTCEIDFSAPGCDLKTSRLALDPQADGVFPDGWSVIVQDALMEAYDDRCSEPDDLDTNEYYDREED